MVVHRRERWTATTTRLRRLVVQEQVVSDGIARDLRACEGVLLGLLEVVTAAVAVVLHMVVDPTITTTSASRSTTKALATIATLISMKTAPGAGRPSWSESGSMRKTASRPLPAAETISLKSLRHPK